jgi:hypothetical protein
VLPLFYGYFHFSYEIPQAPSIVRAESRFLPLFILLPFDFVIFLISLQDLLYYLISQFVLSVFEHVDRDQFDYFRNRKEVWEFESIFLSLGNFFGAAQF